MVLRVFSFLAATVLGILFLQTAQDTPPEGRTEMIVLISGAFGVWLLTFIIPTLSRTVLDSHRRDTQTRQ